MAGSRVRVAFDANILIAGVLWPRWPYEVLQEALSSRFEFVLPEQVLIEAKRHLAAPAQAVLLDQFLERADYEELPLPPREAVVVAGDIVRDETDVPLALALLAGAVDIFVTLDKDFTELGATSARFRERIQVMLPAVFLRDFAGWTSQALEAIRNRRWDALQIELRSIAPPEEPDESR